MAAHDEMLTDAQMAARLGLEIRQFQSALRTGLIPPPRLVAGRRRWTETQLRAVMGETATTDPAGAEAGILDAIQRLSA
ncbi:MAG: hypothetical protein WAS21_27910 [Geminicoccaceae bacterium]